MVWDLFQLHKENDHSKCTSCFFFVGGQWELKLSSEQPGTPKCDLSFSQTTEIIAEISLIGPLGGKEREVEEVGGEAGVWLNHSSYILDLGYIALRVTLDLLEGKFWAALKLEVPGGSSVVTKEQVCWNYGVSVTSPCSEGIRGEETVLCDRPRVII